MTHEDMLTRLDAISTERYPLITDLDIDALKMAIKLLDAEYKEPTTKNNLAVDCISRKSIKQKLQEHHDFFVNAYGGFSNLPHNDKSRVD